VWAEVSSWRSTRNEDVQEELHQLVIPEVKPYPTVSESVAKLENRNFGDYVLKTSVGQLKMWGEGG